MEQISPFQSIMMYQGPFFMDLLAAAANWIRSNLSYDLRVRLKVHKAFIELTQNVSHYSAQRVEMGTEPPLTCGVGRFEIITDQKFVYIQTSNPILPVHGPILTGYCNQINSMSIDQLQILKAANRNHKEVKTSAAHIGLIHVGIISEQPLDFSVEKINEQFSRFTVTAKIQITE